MVVGARRADLSRPLRVGSARARPTLGAPWVMMSDNVDDLVLDLLEWLWPDPRPYADVLDAWRTSCPRLPVWEEANDRGYVARLRSPGGPVLIGVTEAGTERLRLCRPRSMATGPEAFAHDDARATPTVR